MVRAAAQVQEPQPLPPHYYQITRYFANTKAQKRASYHRLESPEALENNVAKDADNI